MRYVGQSWELDVALPGGTLTAEDFADAVARFDAEHERFYGYANAGEECELLHFNLTATATHDEVALPKIGPAPDPVPLARRDVFFGAGEANPVPTPVYRREELGIGAVLEGPAIIGQLDSTTLVPPAATATVDAFGNLLIDLHHEGTRDVD